MKDLVVTGYGESYEDGGIYCSRLDAYGYNSGPSMIWVDYKDEESSFYGWYDDNWEVCYNEAPLAVGEGLWFTSPNTDIKIVSSGEVNSEGVAVVLIVGNQLCPNPLPVTLKMGQVIVDGYGESYEDGGIYCSKLDAFGYNDGPSMIWVDYSDEESTFYGWYDDNWEACYNNSIELAPGEAVWFTSPTASWTLNWPSPLAHD